MSDHHERLNRIEQKLDKIGEVLITLAEQRRDIDHLNEWADKTHETVTGLERWKNRWGGAAVTLGAIGTLFGGFSGLMFLWRVFGGNG